MNAPLEVSLQDRIHFCMMSQSNLSQSQIFDGKICIDTIDTANAVRDCMKQQWSNLVSPGCTVKVKVKDKLASAVVKNCYYISKVSFGNLYCYATAKADVRLPDSRLIRELQFRDLII